MNLNNFNTNKSAQLAITTQNPLKSNRIRSDQIKSNQIKFIHFLFRESTNFHISLIGSNILVKKVANLRLFSNI